MTSYLTPAGPSDLPAPRPPQVPGYGAETGVAHGQRMNPLVRYLQAILRFKWLVVALALLGLAGGLVATKFRKPLYEARATLWFENVNEKSGPIQAEGLLSAGQWVELLTTFSIMDPVVRDRRLYLKTPAGKDSALFRGFGLTDRFLPGKYTLTVSRDGKSYTLENSKNNIKQTGRIGDSVGVRLGLLWIPRPTRSQYGAKVKFDVVTPREASLQLKESLKTDMAGQRARFLRLTLSGLDPEGTAGTLNTLIHRFVDQATALKRQKLTELVATLDTQVTKSQDRLREAERSLEAFRVRTVTLPQEDVAVAPGLQLTQSTVYSEYFQQRRAFESLRRDRRAIQDVLTRATEGALATDAFSTIPSAKSAPDLMRVLGELSTLEAQLRGSLAKYTDEYKGVKDLKEQIAVMRTQTIPAYAQALIAQLKLEEQDLDARITQQSRELESIPVRTITEARLRREVSSAEVLARELESRYETARLGQLSAIPDVQILDEAVAPTRPTKNRAWVFVVMGLFGGLGLGLGLALLIDLLDPKFRYPDQVSHGLGLTILGAIPEIRRAKGGRATVQEAAQVTEAFRAIRLNLVHSFNGGPIAFTVSSPDQGDGKSLVAANLALSFAEAGYRTLLVDGDTRRGELHRTFGVERRPGLLDHLAHGGELNDIFRSTSHTQLALVPCGSRLHHGPELLGSARMNEVMALFRARYQVIIVDSPPLGSGIDPFVLGTVAGNLLMVMRAGETNRQLAESRLQVLDRLPLRLLGAVLNDVQTGHGAYRYYGYSYGYADETDESGGAPQVPARTGGNGNA